VVAGREGGARAGGRASVVLAAGDYLVGRRRRRQVLRRCRGRVGEALLVIRSVSALLPSACV